MSQFNHARSRSSACGVIYMGRQQCSEVVTNVLRAIRGYTGKPSVGGTPTKTAALVDAAGERYVHQIAQRSPSHSYAGGGANPRNYYSGVGETFSPRHVTSFRGLDFSSRLHGWGASTRNRPQFLGGGGGGGLSSGVVQQVRKIFVEVKGNDLERAIRKWRRKCKEENLKALKDREYFKKPSEKRVLALKDRDRRIARRSFKMKLNWILSRRQRGF
ncbi:unnamed protein product [Calypogeia fissa]